MKRACFLLPLVIPSAAMAHPGHGFGVMAGFAHPFSGVDHLMAMIGVGLWAATLGGRAKLALPAAFLAAMALGAALVTNLGGVVEPLVLASVILLGAAVALGLRAPLTVSLPLVAGRTSPTAFAAPVVEGMMFKAAARPPRQSFLEGPSTVFWVAV